MTSALEIRTSNDDDRRALEALYPLAFTDEDLLPLVRELLDQGKPPLSLVALADGRLVGHVIFTPCSVARWAEPLSLLAPLAVTPESQGQGVGSALVRAGLARCLAAGATYAFVLGDPGYYARFGFAAERGVRTPYPIPAEWATAWQSVRLTDDAPPLEGTLQVPPPWQQRALWAP